MANRVRRLWAAAAVAVLLVGAACSVLGATAWASYVRVQATRNFEVGASATADAVSNALQRNTDLAAAARVLVETDPTIANSTFADWFRLLEDHNDYPNSFGLLYIALVSSSQLGSFESRTRAQPPFGVPTRGPFHVVPSGAVPPYCLTDAGVVSLNKRLGISAASLAPLLGLASDELDLCALPIGGLLRASARSGRPAATTLASLLATLPTVLGSVPVPRSLLNALDNDGLITTLTPVYAGAASTPSARMAELRGWVLDVFEGRSVLAPAMAGHPQLSAVLSFRNPSGTVEALDHSSHVGGSRPGTPRHGAVPRDAAAKTFRLPGPGPWTVTLTAATAGTSATTQGVVVLLAGLLVSFLLFAIVRLLVRSRRQAFHLVDERTAELRHQALHDPLTGLPNRASMLERLETALSGAHSKGTPVAAVVVHIDRFDDVKGRFGHRAGDRVLCEAASRLQVAARHAGAVGRLGGDDFLVVLELDGSIGGAEAVARKALGALRAPFRADRTAASATVELSVSVGIATGSGATAETLVGDAVIASLDARSAESHVVVFEPEMRAAVQRRIETESELRAAVAEDRFFAFYQPIIDLRDRRLVGVEALLRWNHPSRGVVSPDEFIPALEETGMIVEVGRRLLSTVCRQVAVWRASSAVDLYVSVNVSARQLERDDIVASVLEAIRDAGLPPGALQLEITETALMSDTDLSARRLAALKETGVKLAVDDFGTGYCSLAYLRAFPVDALKIDRTFVSSMESSHAGRSLVRTVLRMAEDLTLVTVAEGIETRSQLDVLRSEGCTIGQGYLFAPALTASQMSALLNGQGAWQFGVVLGDDGATTSVPADALRAAAVPDIDAESQVGVDVNVPAT